MRQTFSLSPKKGSTPQGFTIVELLIVIAVIAILAAISIVAYNGVQDRAKSAAALSSARTAAQKLALYVTDNGTAPTTLAAAGIDTSGSAIYQYRVGDPSPDAWCVTVTVGKKSARASNSQPAPVVGACSGHTEDGSIALPMPTATLTSTGTMNNVGTVVFVGNYPTTSPHYVFDFRNSSGGGTTPTVLYKYSAGTSASSMNGMAGTFRVESGAMVAYATNPPSSFFVGQRYSLNEKWPGSWKALGYTEVLTQAQIEAIIAQLKGELGL